MGCDSGCDMFVGPGCEHEPGSRGPFRLEENDEFAIERQSGWIEESAASHHPFQVRPAPQHPQTDTKQCAGTAFQEQKYRFQKRIGMNERANEIDTQYRACGRRAHRWSLALRLGRHGCRSGPGACSGPVFRMGTSEGLPGRRFIMSRK